MGASSWAGLTASGFLLAAPVAALSDTPMPAAEPKAKWVVDYAEERCSISRSAGPTGVSFTLRTIVGDDFPDLIIHSAAWREDPLQGRSEAEVSLTPARTALKAEGFAEREADSGYVIFLTGLPGDFVEQFAQAQTLTIRRGNEVIAEVPTPGAAQAVAAFRKCGDDLLRSWGLDPVALAGAKKAYMINSFISPEDYPFAAVREGVQGKVGVRFIVDEAGRARDCKVVLSAPGVKVLQQKTCELIERRARFQPAIAADGAPIASATGFAITWRVNPSKSH